MTAQPLIISVKPEGGHTHYFFEQPCQKALPFELSPSSYEAKESCAVPYTVHLAKENFKFSVTHFTIFGPKSAERMHGHNYQVELNISLGDKLDEKLGFAFDFNKVKPLIKKLCDELDESILIPANSPYLEIKKSKGSVQVTFNGKLYQLPGSDVRLLPIVNITVEELARHLCQSLKKLWKDRPKKVALAVTVEETRGQRVTYSEA